MERLLVEHVDATGRTVASGKSAVSRQAYKIADEELAAYIARTPAEQRHEPFMRRLTKTEE